MCSCTHSWRKWTWPQLRMPWFCLHWLTRVHSTWPAFEHCSNCSCCKMLLLLLLFWFGPVLGSSLPHYYQFHWPLLLFQAQFKVLAVMGKTVNDWVLDYLEGCLFHVQICILYKYCICAFYMSCCPQRWQREWTFSGSPQDELLAAPQGNFLSSSLLSFCCSLKIWLFCQVFN